MASPGAKKEKVQSKQSKLRSSILLVSCSNTISHSRSQRAHFCERCEGQWFCVSQVVLGNSSAYLTFKSHKQKCCRCLHRVLFFQHTRIESLGQTSPIFSEIQYMLIQLDFAQLIKTALSHSEISKTRKKNVSIWENDAANLYSSC